MDNITKSIYDLPWIEKYRPKVLNEIVGNKQAINYLKQIRDNNDIPFLPDLLLYGPPGTGKTSSISALAHELFGKDYPNHVLEINASDATSIYQVFTLINKYISTYTKKGISSEIIIILDEFDSMSQSAQFYLASTLISKNNNIHFCLACNNLSNIISGLKEKCYLLPYKKLLTDDIYNRLLYIIKNENIKYTEQGLKDIVNNSQGDLRIAINNLQSVSIGYQIIDHDNVYKIMDIPKPEDIQIIINYIKNRDLLNAINISDNLINKKGFRIDDIIKQISKIIQDDNEISDNIKVNIKTILLNYRSKMFEVGYSINLFNGMCDSISQLFNINIS